VRRPPDRGRPVLLDLGALRSRGLAAGLITQPAFWSGQASYFLVLALYLQSGRGLDAVQAGLVFTILAAAYLVTSMRAPALTLRFGRSLIAAGALTLAAGHGLVLLAVAAGGGGIGWLVAGLVLAGAGMGLTITPLTTTVLAYASPERAGAVSGVLSTMQQVGGALGVAVTGVFFFGALHGTGGYAHGLELSLAQLGILLVVVAGLTRLRMTHLSIKALRHYHDVGLLPPAEIDASSGYRFYEAEQVPLAQVIRRSELAQTQAVVASLRTLLEQPPAPASVQYRSVPGTRALGITETVSADEIDEWWVAAFTELYGAIRAAGLRPSGPGGPRRWRCPRPSWPSRCTRAGSPSSTGPTARWVPT
jgi:DNA-binding transcriptional MerR regulator